MLAALAAAIVASSANLAHTDPGARYQWLTHEETVSLGSTRPDLSHGRAHHDAFSSEFPTARTSLNEIVLSAVAKAVGQPNYILQSRTYPKLVLAAFLLATFIAVLSITRHPAAALLTTLLLGFTTDPAWFDVVHREFAKDIDAFKSLMHLPALTLPLANPQCAAWVLFMPTLAFAFHASRSDRLGVHLAYGALLGLLIQLHTLTFLHVMTVASAWFFVAHLPASTRGRLVRTGAVLAVFAGLAAWPGPFGTAHFAVLWMALLLSSLRDGADCARLAAAGATALVVALPYLVPLVRVLVSEGFEVSVDTPIHPALVGTYYAIFWVLAAVAVLRPKSDAVKFALVLIAVSLALGFGQLYGFRNHQYRFVINLCFGLFMLGPLVLAELACAQRAGRRPPALSAAAATIVLGLAVVAVSASGAYRDAKVVRGEGEEVAGLGHNRRFFGVRQATTAEARFLDAVASLPGEGRMLLPPESAYPARAVHQALVLGTAGRRGFIPDYRYIVDPESYRERVEVFCALFPGYAHHDEHTGRKLCDTFRATGQTPSAADAIGALALYGVRYIAWWPLEGDRVPDVLPGTVLVHRDDAGFRIFELSCDPGGVAGGACFEPVDRGPGHVTFRVRAGSNRAYRLRLAGTNAARRVASIAANGRDLPFTTHGRHAVETTVVPDDPATLIRVDVARHGSTSVPAAPFHGITATAIEKEARP